RKQEDAERKSDDAPANERRHNAVAQLSVSRCACKAKAQRSTGILPVRPAAFRPAEDLQRSVQARRLNSPQARGLCYAAPNHSIMITDKITSKSTSRRKSKRQRHGKSYD